jgi:hypothetical protein
MEQEELLNKIDELESRLEALESGSHENCDDKCPECCESPCVCDEEPEAEREDVGVGSEIGVIAADDVDEIEELDFDIPSFMASDDYENDEENTEADGGLYNYENDENEEDEEDSPYFN